MYEIRAFLSLSQLSDRLDGSYVASSDLTMRPGVRCTKHSATRTPQMRTRRAAPSVFAEIESSRKTESSSRSRLQRVVSVQVSVVTLCKPAYCTSVPRALFGKLQLALGLVAARVEEATTL